MPRNKLYNPEELENLFHQYREWSADNPIVLTKESYGKLVQVPHHRPLTLKGFYAYAIEYHNTGIHHYFQNTKGSYDEYISLCKDIKTIIHSELTNLALVGGVKEGLASKILGLADELKLHGEVKNTIPEVIHLTTVYTEHNKPKNYE